MNRLGDRLREADPLLRDPGLSDTEAAAMRRRVVDEATARPRRNGGWHHAMAVAAAVALMIAVGITAGRRLPAPAVPADRADGVVARPAERRQLQFATPGGTRIIWTFDSEFSLKETMP